MAFEEINFGYDDLHCPEQETVPPNLPIQEYGPEPITITCRLYDVCHSPWRQGSYILKCMPKSLAEEITEAMATMNSVAHPKGFTNQGQKHYSWDVKLDKNLKVEVNVLDDFNLDDYSIHFTSKQNKMLTRKQIVSQPSSRLPSNCASVEFTIHSRCETTREMQFRVKVETDLETVTRDYNIMES